MSAMDGQKLIVLEFGAAVIGADRGEHRAFMIGQLVVLACTIPIAALLVTFLT